jgi:hypothetical protein
VAIVSLFVWEPDDWSPGRASTSCLVRVVWVWGETQQRANDATRDLSTPDATLTLHFHFMARVIHFSSLPEREKEKFYQFFVDEGIEVGGG